MTFHDAYLMESFRNEDGDPRQRTITYLGNIRQIDDDFPTIERELFLLRADIILQSQPDVSSEDHQKAMQQLQERVPPLDADEVMNGFRNTLRWYCQWWQENGEMPSTQTLLTQIQQAKATTDKLLHDEE